MGGREEEGTEGIEGGRTRGMTNCQTRKGPRVSKEMPESTWGAIFAEEGTMTMLGVGSVVVNERVETWTWPPRIVRAEPTA